MIERLILALKRRRNGDDSSPLLNYFRIVLNFGYILFLIPFRLKIGSRTRAPGSKEQDSDAEEPCGRGRSQVELKSSRIHQCICAIVHCLIMFEYLSLARRRFSWLDLFGTSAVKGNGTGHGTGPSGSSSSAFESLQTVGCIACIVYGVAFIYTFWARRDAWLRAFRLIDEIGIVSTSTSTSDNDSDSGCDDSSSPSSWWIGFKINMLGITLCAMYTAFGLLDTTFEHNIGVDNNLKGFFAKHYAETQELYLFRGFDEQTTPGSAPPFEHTFTTGLTILRMTIAFQKFLLIQVLEWTVLMTVLCLRHVMANFLKLRPRKTKISNSEGCGKEDRAMEVQDEASGHGLFQRTRTEQQLLQNSSSPTPDGGAEQQIFAHYDRLKQLVKTLNSATKVLTFSCIGVALPFYASWIVIVFFEENVEWRQFAHFYFYFGVFFSLLVLAAEFNAKSVNFYRWIARADNSEQVSPNRLSSILIDLQCNEVAVKGSAIFVVTYRFIGGFLSVIVTYTIIMLQFQVSKRSRVGTGH